MLIEIASLGELVGYFENLYVGIIDAAYELKGVRISTDVTASVGQTTPEISPPVNIRELKQRRRRRRGRLLVKNEFIFYKQNSRLFRSARYANGSINVFKPKIHRGPSIPNRNTTN